MGGNAMTECVVSGIVAGRFAAERALGKIPVPSCREKPRQVPVAGAVPGAGEVQGILSAIRATAWECAGIVRSDEWMCRGMERLEAIENRLKPLGGAAGTGGCAILEDARAGALVLRAILQASLGRLESRGSFLRSDFPDEDDGNWRRNSCLSYDADKNAFTVKYLPVEGV
jgi:succinate dehydrogenase/fumarate reductase flavoprotein subunit